ncbi:MAG: hypothetical protein VB048_01230 [Bacteroidaceae bacterium]|nr:hypothetical protein [Bacteroidaceae bacterium]
MEKRVLIIGYQFYPQNSPRAFRTYELVKEFVRRGIKVDLILPNKEVFAEQNLVMENDNLNITYLGDSSSFKRISLANSFKIGFFRQKAKQIYRYFNPFAENRGYINLVYAYLRSHKVDYDLILAIAHPFSTLVGTAKAIRHNDILNQSPVKIAEYSDPFTVQNLTKMFPLYRVLDRWIANTFDYLSIPTEKALTSYLKIKDADKIKVIPQGFDFSEIELNDYNRNPIPSFGYAGVFYEKIRNPEVFFDYLVTLECDFRFYLYTSSSNMDTKIMINKYKDRLQDKMVLSYDIPRLELLKRLRSLDFLINLNNTSNIQVPSKIIDYTLTKRPIYSFSQNDFDVETFQSFMEGNYERALSVDITQFDIRNVADQFLQLR